MRNNIVRKTLLIGLGALTIVSCGEDPAITSVVTSFKEFPAILESSPVTVGECGVTETFEFKFNAEDQITDMTLEVHVGSSSTATEDVDFVLDTHEIELLAFEGQDGFSVDVTVLQDFEIEDGDEEIYLVFTTETPSGISRSETKVITIEDSGIEVEASDEVDLTLRWEFDDPDLSGTDQCDMDLDLTIQPEGEDIYDSDLIGYGLASLACPEEGTLDITTMNDGEVYEVWFAIYSSLDVAPEDPAVTVYLDYARADSDFNGTVEISGVFDADMAAAGGVLLTIEKNCNVITLKDTDGNVLGEGRIGSPQLQTVQKPI